MVKKLTDYELRVICWVQYDPTMKTELIEALAKRKDMTFAESSFIFHHRLRDLGRDILRAFKLRKD